MLLIAKCGKRSHPKSKTRLVKAGFVHRIDAGRAVIVIDRFAGRAGLQPPAPLGGERKEHDEKADSQRYSQ
jgi:hypothetical protein